MPAGSHRFPPSLGHSYVLNQEARRLLQHRSPLLTAAQAARVVNASPRSIQRWIADGDLEAIRLGPSDTAHYRIPEDALEKFIRPAGAAARG